MKENIIISMDTVAMFCRFQMNIKRDIPIRASEMGVLIFAQKSEMPVTPLMISNFFRISKPSVTTMVNSLIKNNYLVKTQQLTDKRSFTVSVTSRGNELVDATYNEYFSAMELLEDKMGVKEFELLIQLLQKANEILGEERRG